MKNKIALVTMVILIALSALSYGCVSNNKASQPEIWENIYFIIPPNGLEHNYYNIGFKEEDGRYVGRQVYARDRDVSFIFIPSFRAIYEPKEPYAEIWVDPEEYFVTPYRIQAKRVILYFESPYQLNKYIPKWLPEEDRW